MIGEFFSLNYHVHRCSFETAKRELEKNVEKQTYMDHVYKNVFVTSRELLYVSLTTDISNLISV